MQLDIWHPEDPKLPNTKEYIFSGSAHWFRGAHFYYSYRKLPRSKISGSWEEEPDLWGTNRNQKSCNRIAKTEKVGPLRAGLNFALQLQSQSCVPGRWRTNMESFSIAEFEVPLFWQSWRYLPFTGTFLSCCTVQVRGECSLHAPHESSSHLAWVTGKEEKAPWEAEAPLALPKLQTPTSAWLLRVCQKPLKRILWSWPEAALNWGKWRRGWMGASQGLLFPHSGVQAKLGFSR